MYKEFDKLIITNKKGNIPNLPFLIIKEKVINKILGKNFSLSINFIQPKLAKELNIKYRNKNYIPNILSFPISKNEGEIFICLSIAKMEAKKFSLSYYNFLKLLIIHGCLHLSGINHGIEMENLEEKYLEKILND